MEVVYIYSEDCPYQMIWCLCGSTQFYCFSDSNDIMKWKGDGVWYGILLLEV